MKTEDLVGQTITEWRGAKGDGEIRIRLDDGRQFSWFHHQDCCEGVEVEDIEGDPNDLLDTPLLMAEESVSENENPDGVTRPTYQDSFTWTFYRFATVRGYVTVRWYGESNGYYSEDVDFKEVKP